MDVVYLMDLMYEKEILRLKEQVVKSAIYFIKMVLLDDVAFARQELKNAVKELIAYEKEQEKK